MKRAKTILAWVSLAAMPCAMAQQGGRDAFVQQQAYAEMQRVSGQIDVLQGNVDDLAATVRRLERANAAGDTESLRSRVAALEASVAALRRDLQSQRAEIVKEISARIAKMLHDRPAPQPQKSEPAFTGSYREYTVVAGDTLSIIAQAFKTTVARLKEMNSLKSDVLRVGQVLKVPADK